MKYSIRQAPGRLTREELDDPRFDSDLLVTQRNDHTNVDLIITLRILFKKVERYTDGAFFKDTNNQTFELRNWGEAEWIAFKRDACAMAQRAWNEKLWLMTPDYYDGLDWPTNNPTHRANVHCGFRCVEASSPLEAHAQVRVACLLNPVDGVAFRSNFTLWDNCDMVKAQFNNATSPGEVLDFYTVPHEVGHLLGLHHIGEVERLGACVSPPAGAVGQCYANTPDARPWMQRNIMGTGTIVHDINGDPWAKRMAMHTEGDTRASHWKVQAVRCAPRRIVRAA